MGTEDLANAIEQLESNLPYETRKKDEEKITGKKEKSRKVQEKIKDDQKKSTDTQQRIEERQNEVYLLRLRGLTNKQIAEKLNVSLSTVEKDLHEVKTNVVKTFKVFQDAGVLEAFQDACGQIDMVQRELWNLYDSTHIENKLKILNTLRENAASKLEIYEIVPRNSRLLFESRQRDQNEKLRAELHKKLQDAA